MLLGSCDHVPLCQSLNFRLGHGREVCVFGSDDPSRNVGMMGLQVFFQEVGGVAFPGGVTDEDDLIRSSEVFRDFLIERILWVREGTRLRISTLRGAELNIGTLPSPNLLLHYRNCPACNEESHGLADGLCNSRRYNSLREPFRRRGRPSCSDD